MNPYCFVITSFGTKDDLNDTRAKANSWWKKPVRKINFDSIYQELVKPAILKADLEPLIEYEEKAGGSIHKTMYEKIILCEFCIADLTNFNPNVYYELGMRFAVKPFTTIPIIASAHFPLPFDIAPDRIFTYQVDQDFNLSDKENDINNLVELLINAKKKRTTDSPLYDLVNGISFQNSVAHEKTDVFRDKVLYDNKIKEKLAYARSVADPVYDKDKIKLMRIEAINRVVQDCGPLENLETGVLIDMMISYRNIEAFTEMEAFIDLLPRYVYETVMVREQHAFILNRNGGKAKPVDGVKIMKAENILKKLEEEGKASSETYGIWGRIYKDQFDRYYKEGKKGEALAQLEIALDYYRKGFESDPRDAYPGVNYVTCLELLGKKDEALRIVPAVEYAVKTKMKRKKPDYWDYATLFELAVIENRYQQAEEFLIKARPMAIEAWMLDTTKNNLEKIMNYRKERGEKVDELTALVVGAPPPP